MVLMGKSGEGLFLATSDNGVFNTPLPIPTLDNVFMADAEGPSIAVHGSTLGLAYQVSGEWATGGQYMSTQDGGQTWSASFPISPMRPRTTSCPCSRLTTTATPLWL